MQKPILEWAKYLVCDKDTVINTSHYDTKKLQSVTDFTLRIAFEVERFPTDNHAGNKVELFGHSEEECWGLLVDRNSLYFG